MRTERAKTRARAAAVACVALTLGLFAALYRFNTLGGALGGFDNDHFLHFVYAKQVQAGAQPLRDFLDGGLQGARPSLTYELTALAQRTLGENLRSEALLTAGALGVAAALTFVAASAVSPWYWAALTTILGVLLAPKLYGYPKVLMLAGASLLVIRYSSRPTKTTVAAMAVWTAVAFLFRHDYAVYVSVAFGLVIALAADVPVVGRISRLAGLAAAAGLLLTPSLLWLQSHAGLLSYFRNALAMGQREAARTSVGWSTFELHGGIGELLRSGQNATTWLYYVLIGVPAVAAIAVLKRRRSDRAAPVAGILAVAAMAAVSSHYFLRGNIAARLGEAVPPVAVLAAMLLGGWQTATVAGKTAVQNLARATAFLALLITIPATWIVGDVNPELERAGLSVSFDAMKRQSRRVANELAAFPDSIWNEPQPRDSMLVAQYLHRCTRATDRVLVMTYAPEILAFADRRFAGGRATIIPGFYDDPGYTALTLSRLEAESVPIVLADDVGAEEPSEFSALYAYLHRHYVRAGTATVDGGRVLGVFARRDARFRAFAPNGWPCRA